MKAILGSGQLGTAILEALLKHNPQEDILVVNREGKLSSHYPANVQTMAADVTSKEEMTVIAQASEVIYSCTDVPYQLWGSFYPATAAALAYALGRSGARLVYADNMYSYGNVHGELIHPQMPHAAATRKGMIRTSVINTLLLSGQDFSQRVAFVKAADFIGPRIHKGLFGTDFLDKLYHNKTVVLSGKLSLPHTFSCINDFAQAMINVGSAVDTFGQVWHVPNAKPMSVHEWIRLFETSSGRKVRTSTIPKAIVWIAGLFNSMISEFYELAYQFEYPYLVDHSKYVNRFGNHATDPSIIVAETLQWYQSQQNLRA